MKHFHRVLVMVLWILTANTGWAMEIPATSPTPAPRGLTVAILDFEANLPGHADLGSQIGQTLTAMLSSESGLVLVERPTLARVLQEHELSLTGLVTQTDQAVKVGKLVGARIMVVGKAFVLGEQLFITAKMIGTETSLVEGVLVKGKTSGDTGELVVQLSEKLASRLRDAGPKLTGGGEIEPNPLPGLKEKLQKLAKPVVAVVVIENHLASRPAASPDPAAETEIKHLLVECGFVVKDVSSNKLAEWAKTQDKQKKNAWPQELAGVDVVITGEGFSEFAARIGNLVSCLGRVEINVIQRSDGRILLADRVTVRAVDLSEGIAGKKALQKSGQVLGLRVLDHFAKTLPPAAAGKTHGR